MRTIVKRGQPVALATWRNERLRNHELPADQRKEGVECDYDALRSSAEVLAAVENQLYEEQGGLCAYTGIKLVLTTADPSTGTERHVGFHLEHLKAQKHCKEGPTALYGQDADYENLVACWPPPNRKSQEQYGAHPKGDWPDPDPDLDQVRLFVSPLARGCEARFKYDHRGEVTAADPADMAVTTTINKLVLNHKDLVALRKAAIKSFLAPRNEYLGGTQARRLLDELRQASQDLNRGQPVMLLPFCFAIEPALERHIRKQEGSQASRMRTTAAAKK